MTRHAIAALSLGAILVLAACGGSETSDLQSEGSASLSETAAVVSDFEKFGASVTLTDRTPISSLSDSPEAFVDKQVLIEGKVTGVCKGSGCWVRVEGKEGSSIIARSLDHSVTVPTDCEGRHILVQGAFLTMPVESSAKTEEEDHEEGEGHECPRPTYVLSMDGVQLGAGSVAS
jgi:hypothetical protein